MSDPRVMTFYLEPSLRQSAEAGEHNFLGKVAALGRAAGMEIRFRGNSPAERAMSYPEREYAVLHMDPVPHRNAVTLRRAYYYPFWSIEQTDRRWEFDVARARFDPGKVSKDEARGFVDRWRRKWFDGWGDGPKGHVYIALQGRLLEQRSFQSCTPVEMIEAVLSYMPGQPVIAGLHPGESYSEAELSTLRILASKYRNLTVRKGGMSEVLPGCTCVVTQNSAVGFAGLIWHKPLVLFGRIDFHHIAATVWDSGPDQALGAVSAMRPDYDTYVWWFLQHMAINAGRPEADEKIAIRLRSFGWPV